jgi:hypothetical protein
MNFIVKDNENQCFIQFFWIVKLLTIKMFVKKRFLDSLTFWSATRRLGFGARDVLSSTNVTKVDNISNKHNTQIFGA